MTIPAPSIDVATVDPDALLRSALADGFEDLYATTAAYGTKLTKSAQRGPELASEAIARTISKKRAWNPAERSLLRHLLDVVRSLVSNERKMAKRRRADAQGDPDAVPDSGASPERVHERAAREAMARAVVEDARAELEEKDDDEALGELEAFAGSPTFEPVDDEAPADTKNARARMRRAVARAAKKRGWKP